MTQNCFSTLTSAEIATKKSFQKKVSLSPFLTDSPTTTDISCDYATYLKKNHLILFFKDTLKMLSGENADMGCHHYMPSKSTEDKVDGSSGWAKLCNHPDYHIGKEINSLSKYSHEISKIIGQNAMIIDYGVGDNKGLEKTCALLDNLNTPIGYIALDYNEDYVNHAAQFISERYSSIKNSKAVPGDFFLWKPEKHISKPVGLCFGGTIVNVSEDRSPNLRKNIINVLKTIRERLGEGAYFIVSQDTNQSETILGQGYDPEVCADWQLNIFHRMIRDLKATGLDPDAFEYKVEWRKDEYCYAHCAVATKDQENIEIGNKRLNIKKGQVFDMTRGYKYPIEIFYDVIEKSGWKREKSFLDKNGIAYHICKY